MIIFYTKDAEEVVLASIVKHSNPNSMLVEYSDNTDILRIAKIHNDPHFVRIKDYKLAIINKYEFPSWIKNESRLRFIELVLANEDTVSNELVTHLAKNLFNPELLFYSSLDKTLLFKNRAMQVINELGIFKKHGRKFYSNGLLHYEINPKNDISLLFVKDLMETIYEPFIVLNGNAALVGNAEFLGFSKNIVDLSRYDALKLKKTLIVKAAKRQEVKATIPTRICEF